MTGAYWCIVEPLWNQIKIDSAEIFLGTYSNAPPEAALLYASHFCQSEVCNGGFWQLFFNSTGVLAPEAVLGFRAIGQNRIADLVENAMLPFGSPYLRDREARRALLDTLPPKAFDNLDEQFFALIETEAGGFDAAADRYAAQIGR